MEMARCGPKGTKWCWPFFFIGKKIGEVPGRESLAPMSGWTGQTFEV